MSIRISNRILLTTNIKLTCSAVIGSSSAVGVASMKSFRMGMSKSSAAQAMKRFRSTLLTDPIGLISAEEPSEELVLVFCEGVDKV